jgi:hypothetical protein
MNVRMSVRHLGIMLSPRGIPKNLRGSAANRYECDHAKMAVSRADACAPHPGLAGNLKNRRCRHCQLSLGTLAARLDFTLVRQRAGKLITYQARAARCSLSRAWSNGRWHSGPSVVRQHQRCAAKCQVARRRKAVPTKKPSTPTVVGAVEEPAYPPQG